MIERCSDGEMQNILKLYGEDPGPIRETTRLMYEKRLAKHLDQRTTPTKLLINLLYIFWYIFILFFYSFISIFIYLFNFLIGKKIFFSIYLFPKQLTIIEMFSFLCPEKMEIVNELTR